MSDQPTADTMLAAGAVTAPASGATIATLVIPGTGIGVTARYKFRATIYQTGTIDTAHEASLQLQHGTTVLGPLLSTPVESVVEGFIQPNVDTDVSIKTTAAFAAGAIVCATLALTRIG